MEEKDTLAAALRGASPPFYPPPPVLGGGAQTETRGPSQYAPLRDLSGPAGPVQDKEGAWRRLFPCHPAMEADDGAGPELRLVACPLLEDLSTKRQQDGM